jgi:hypothetical protein
MKKISIFLISLLLILSSCTKDIRIQGFVNTKKGVPIEDVTVSIQKSKLTGVATTDNTGYYVFDNVAAGTWELTVSKEGFKSQSETFSVSAGSGGNIYTKNFELDTGKTNPPIFSPTR